MKTVAVTFQHISGVFKVVKVTNTTRFLPGETYTKKEVEGFIAGAPRDHQYIITK